MMISTRWSFHCLLSFMLSSHLSRNSVINHFNREGDHDSCENQSQPAHFGFDQYPRPQQGTGKHAEHDGHGETGIDVAAVEINAGARGRGYADHEIAGRGGNFEGDARSEEHTSELQSRGHLVCRLLLEK